MKNSYLWVLFIFLMGVQFYFLLDTHKRLREDKKDKKLYDISKKIDSLKNEYKTMQDKISEYGIGLDSLNLVLESTDKEKTVIKEYYYEKIKSFDTISSTELDSFFANRYGQYKVR
jgi:translation elongation factor EF-1beta